MEEWLAKFLPGYLEDDLDRLGGAIEKVSVETYRGRHHIKCHTLLNNERWFKVQGGCPSLYFREGGYKFVVSPEREVLWLGYLPVSSISREEYNERSKKIEGKHLTSLIKREGIK